MLMIMMTVVVIASFGDAFAGGGPNTNLPFADTFESYTNDTPLIDGTNGWYGDTNTIIVVANTNIAPAGSTNVAMLPLDCTLSNRFQDVAATNLWLQMDVLPVLYRGTNNPVVNTNQAVMFYINSNGNFKVHNGPASPDPTNSTRWVEVTRGGIDPNVTNWVTLQVRVNYANQTWGLYNLTGTNRALVTNNIAFINPNQTNFLGFSAYNGLATSYVDNVTVTSAPVANLYLGVTPDTVTTNNVMRFYSTNSTLTITNKDVNNMNWTVRATETWLQMDVTNGAVAGNRSTNLVVRSSAASLAAGTYTGSVIVSATSADEFLSPESVVVTFVLQVMELQRSPAQLTNAVMQGDGANDSFQIWNAGPANLEFVATANQPWITLSQTTGTLTGETAYATNTIFVAYTNTAGLSAGDHHGTITITALKGGSVTIDVILTVRSPPMLSVSPALVTNMVMAGQNLADQALRIWNASAFYPIGYRVTTNQGGASTNWLTVEDTNNYRLDTLMTNTLTLKYSVSSLTNAGDVPSNYYGAITLTATNRSEGSPVTIPVNVQVVPKPRLALSLTNLSPTALQGKDAVSQAFEVRNASGFYTLNYTITNSFAPWLVLSRAGGSLTGQTDTIGVQYSTANLPAGTTTAVITVVGRASDGVHEASARDATQHVVVALSVMPFATLTTDAQSEYSYTLRKGTTSPTTNFKVWNGGALPGAMFFAVSPSESWLSVTPSSGTSTGSADKVNIRVQTDTTGMRPGVVYSSTVRIDATDLGSGATAYGSPIVFTIAVVVRNFQGFDFSGGLSAASDLVLYRETDGAWEIRNLLSNYATNQFFGGMGYQAVPGDYAGDGITDLGVYRPTSGSWYAQRVGSGSAQVIEMQQWAGSAFVGVPGDYDGDGKTDPGVYLEQSGLWMVLMSGSGYQQVSGIFGGPEYSALLAGDYDGDMRTDPGVYNRTSGLWFLLFSTSESVLSGTFGGAGFVPVPTDYDGDGVTDPALYETETGRWYILPSTTLTSSGYSLAIYQFGGVAMSANLVPAPGDYDGVGGADLALYDTATSRWYIVTLGGVPLAWGYPMGQMGFYPVLP